MATKPQSNSMLPSAWTPMWYHPIQHALWTCKSRFAAVVAGRGSGKTELAKRRLVRYLRVKKPWEDPRYFYGGPTYGQAQRVAWEHLKNLIPRWWIRSVNAGELCIRTVFGSELWVIGLDQPQRVEGVMWDGCVLDESSDLRPKTFDLSIFPALAHRRGWCWRIGVPKRHGIGAVEFRSYFEQASAGKLDDVEAFTWPSAEIIADDVLANARKVLDPVDYLEQFEARWQNVGGQVYHAFDEAWNVRPCSYNNGKPIIVGSDFNVDPMCWVLCHRYKDRLEAFDEICRRDTNTQDTLSVLRQKYVGHEGGFAFFGDATGRARKTSASSSDYLQILGHDWFKKAGRTIHYPESNPAVADMLAATNAMFFNAAGDRRLFIAPHCNTLIRDMKMRSYRPGTRDPSDKTQASEIGHMADALGYVIAALYPIRITETEPAQVWMTSG